MEPVNVIVNGNKDVVKAKTRDVRNFHFDNECVEMLVIIFANWEIQPPFLTPF